MEPTGPLVFTTENDPSLWRTESYIKRRNARRNAALTQKNRPSFSNKVRSWFKKPGDGKTRRSRRRRRRSTPRIMYE